MIIVPYGNVFKKLKKINLSKKPTLPYMYRHSQHIDFISFKGVSKNWIKLDKSVQLFLRVWYDSC